jgi:hypothetical protein
MGIPDYVENLWLLLNFFESEPGPAAKKILVVGPELPERVLPNYLEV